MKRMWGVKKVFSFMFLALTGFVLLTACGGGGGSDGGGGNNNQTPPPATNATITGTVAGTTVKAFDLSGNEVASNTATGNPKTFSLNVPANGSYKFYLIENEGTASERVYALYQGTTNVFNIASAVTIDLGFVDTSTGKAVPTNNPLNVTGVTSGGENTAIPPSLIKQYTASGTYTYNSVTGALTINFTSSNFVCEGPSVGNSTFTVSSITATTMIWNGGTTDEATWTRPSGTAGDIVGTWTMSNSSTGNSYTLTFNTGGTLSVAGYIVSCTDSFVRAMSVKEGNQYYKACLFVYDETQQYTSVTVTGPYITGSLSLPYDTANKVWGGRYLGCFFLDSTTPPTPLAYAFTLNSSSGTTYITDNIESFVEPFATNLSPSTGQTVSAPPTFSWTGVGSGYKYAVEVFSSGNKIWEDWELTTTSVPYAGPPLTSGGTYNYNVYVKDTYGNISVAGTWFVVQ